jgi:hypothetical protein
MLIQGKICSGKTNLGLYVANKLSDVIDRKQMTAFCGTDTCRKEWSKTCETFDADIGELKTVLDRQEKLVNEDRVIFERDHPDLVYSVPTKLRTALFFDSVGANEKFLHDEQMLRLVTKGKKLGVYSMFIVQNIKQLRSEILENQYFIMTTKCTSETVVQKLYEEYIGSKLMTKSEFNTVLTAATSRLGSALLINNSVTSNNVSDVLYYVVFPLRVV